MTRTPQRVAMPAALFALALFVAACGSSSNNGSGGVKSSAGQKIPQGKQGGDVTVLSAGDVDYMDPGQMYYTFGYMIGYAVNRPLYSFKPDNATKPVPDLAASDPQITDGQKTITVKLRTGVKFSPPVNREVQCKDVKYAMSRVFSANVPNPYATGYFGTIQGAPKTPAKGIPNIPGIQCPDPTTLVLKLTQPKAATIAAALVMPLTMPVPEEYAKPFDAKNPSTYDTHVAFTGPYMVKNDAKGNLTGWKRAKSIELVRNPNWDKSTDYRPAYLDAIHVDEGNADSTVASRRILNGSHLIQGDGAPPAPVLKQAATRFKNQLVLVPAGGTRYVAMNTKVKPFDNVNVRRAVFAIFDRNAMRLTRGGPIVGDIAWRYIPPGIPGFDEAGGLNPPTDPSLDFAAHPAGDPAIAKKYMLLAKQQGVPVTADGKYAGKEKLLTIATNADPGKKSAEVAANQFEKLGFKLNFREVTQDALYTKFCGVPKAQVAICPNVGFFKDFVDPESFINPTFNGEAILPANNTNWPQLDVPSINKAIDDAAILPPGKGRDEAFAKIDLDITKLAPAVPWLWDKTPLIESKDVQGVADNYSTVWSLSYTSDK
jgi:peptide/nickel transport system substrate-binding protein